MSNPPDFMIPYRANGYVRASLIEAIDIDGCAVKTYLRGQTGGALTYVDYLPSDDEAKAFAKSIAEMINASLSGGQF